MRITSITFAAALAAVAGCGDKSGGSDAPKRVSATGATMGIAVDSDQHVAYLLNAPPSHGAKGELHVADAAGKDTLIAMNISVGGYLLSPRGKGMLYTVANDSGDDASLFWVDLSAPSAGTQVFASGLSTQPVNPGTATPTMTVPLTQQGFLTPSGRFFVMGVLPANVSVSPDLHVIDMDTGADVFQALNGGFDYLELVLPDDTMIFQDAEGNNTGPSAPPGVQKLYYVSLSSGGQRVEIAQRTGGLQPSGDNKTLVYQNADTRELYSWDAVAKPASGIKVASGALNFAVGDSGPIAYIGTDHSVHVVDFTGKEVMSVAGTTANADFLSPIYISGDGADVYWFQNVFTQNAQGTLMHVAATAGATPNKVADAASISDVRPLAGGVLLYLGNVDGMGDAGDVFKAARDGSGATPLGTGVQVGFLTVVTSASSGAMWVSPHLTMSTEDKNKQLADNIRAITGALELTTPSGTTTVDPATRIGQFTLSEDVSTLVYVGGSAFDAMLDNYVGSLEVVPTASPATKPAMPLLTGVSEIGVVTNNNKIFVNAPKATTPGVYLVNTAPKK